MSRALRDLLSKANLYIIRRRLYRTADPAFRGADAALDVALVSIIRMPPRMQSTDTSNFQPSVFNQASIAALWKSDIL